MRDDRALQANGSGQLLRVKCSVVSALEMARGCVSRTRHDFQPRKMKFSLHSNWDQQFLRVAGDDLFMPDFFFFFKIFLFI